MDTATLTIGNLMQHLRTADAPLSLCRDGKLPVWSDEALHRAAYAADPALYALMALGDGVTAAQRARVLFQILKSSRMGLTDETRQTLDRVVAFLLAVLHPDQTLTVFLALRRVRANHKHTTRAMARYLLNHPGLTDMVARRRPAVVDCLEHALGKNVARACVKQLTHADGNPAYLRRNLLRFAELPEAVAETAPALYRPPLGTGALPARTEPAYMDTNRAYRETAGRKWERPDTVTATNRGDIAATLVPIYQGGDSPALREALDRYVAQAAARLPRFAGRMALVLDVSASTQSYGDREFCCLAQSVALMRVLERCCADLRLFYVGGSGDPPRPEGSTDLAGGLLKALEDDPDLVAIVSDGYENTLAGDLARVAATLPCIGVTTPVVFCHSKFTNTDDLTLRRPAPALPELAFWHQEEFEDLLLALFALARSPYGETSLRAFLTQKLDSLVVPQWES